MSGVNFDNEIEKKHELMVQDIRVPKDSIVTKLGRQGPDIRVMKASKVSSRNETCDEISVAGMIQTESGQVYSNVHFTDRKVHVSLSRRRLSHAHAQAT